MNNLTENNKLIAEFMGGKVQVHPLGHEEDEIIFPVSPTSLEGMPQRAVERLKYHTSWDWLMPVVEKIEDLSLMVSISEKNCQIMWIGTEPEDAGWLTKLENLPTFDVDEINKITAVYTCIVDFIKWYNLNK